MRLSELRPSLSELNRADALALILKVRKSRRTAKRKVTKAKAKGVGRIKKTPMQTLLKGLGDKDISALITMLEEQNK